MNELQIEKIREQAVGIGFEAAQDKLVEDCEALIEAAQGEDYDIFIEKLANVSAAIIQVLLTLSAEQQEQYTEATNIRLGIQTDTDEDEPNDEDLDIDSDDAPY